MVRPRSARAHDNVLKAALQLFADRGIDATSMDAIAESSGVSKATIYKHWPDKDALCLEVMMCLHASDAPQVDIGHKDLRADLVAVLSHRPSERHADLRMRVMPHLMAHAARNPAFAKAWQGRFLEQPRADLRGILARAVERRDLPETLDIELAIALLLGPVFYGALRKRMGQDVAENLAELVVEAFMRCYTPADDASRRKRSRSMRP